MPKEKEILNTATQVHEKTELIKKTLRQGEMMWWVAASQIYEIKQKEHYKDIGYLSFLDYCEGGLECSYQTIRKLLRAYEVAVVKLGYKTTELPERAKLYLVTDLMESDPKKADEYLEMAHNLSSDDIRKEKNAIKTGIDEYGHEHEGSFYAGIHCVKCKNLIRFLSNADGTFSDSYGNAYRIEKVVKK